MKDFGPYRPDQPDTVASSNILNVLANTIASGGVFYSPLPSMVALPGADAIPAQPRGVGTAITSGGSYKIYVGTATGLYEVAADGVVTTIGTGYNLPGGDAWGMLNFGSYMLFSNTTDGMLQYNINSGGAVAAVSGAPKAKTLFEAFNCVFALDCDGENRLMRNSDFNDHTDWAGGAAGYQVFEGGGELMAGAALNQYGAAVFQRNAVHLLRGSGDASVYSISTLSRKTGCVNPRAMQVAKGMAFFVDNDGFWLFDGQSLSQIGQNKVNETFINSMMAAGGGSTVEVAVDDARQRFVARYKGKIVSSNTVFDDLISYHWDVGEFVKITEQTSALATLATPGYTLDNINSFGTLDTLPYSLDSNFWRGGEPRLAAFDSSYKLAYFDGSNKAATLETPCLRLPRSQLVTSLGVDTDAQIQSANVTVQLGVKGTLNGTTTWKTAAQIQPSGRVPVRGRGKVMASRLNIAAGETWTEATRIDFPIVSQGGFR